MRYSLKKQSTHTTDGVTSIEIEKGDITLIALFDDDDETASVIAPYRIGAIVGKNTFYAVQAGRRRRGESVLVHRLLTAAPPSLFVDHINGNGLDNRRVNLRLVTNSQNMQNALVHKHSRSGTRGVHQIQNGRWRGLVAVEGRAIHLGYFDTETEAAAVVAEHRRNLGIFRR